jgi:RAD50-interacting protein 1
MIVTSSDMPEAATQRLRDPLEKLRKLQLAEQYIDMLEYIEGLKDSARGLLPQNPKEALEPYTQLKELAIQLEQLQEPAVRNPIFQHSQNRPPKSEGNIIVRIF